MDYTEKLLALARSHQAVGEVDTDDESVRTVHIVKDDTDLFVWLRKYDNAFIPIDIDSDQLVRELYGDPYDDIEAAQKRAEEICANIKKIISGSGIFHPKPSLLNKERGYILLPLDGKETKIMQRRNSFGFSRDSRS